jgi:hypothetical protein
LTASLVLTLGAFLVWVFEPPAPGAVMIGMHHHAARRPASRL